MIFFSVGNPGNGLLKLDNKVAIALAKNPVYHQRTRYIDIKYHLLQYNLSWPVTSLNGHLHSTVTFWSSKCILCINDL